MSAADRLALDRQLLDLISRGYSNGQIALTLYYTEDSIKGMVRALYRRLGVRDRAYAVRRGFELGWLTVDGDVDG